MFKNYFKIAARNLLRHKVFSLINLSGFAVGMACCLLIFLYLQHELTYDHFHQNFRRLYRVIQEFKGEDGVFTTSFVGPAMAPNLLNDFPEIEHAVRFYRQPALVVSGEKRFQEDRFLFAEATVFDVFTFPLVMGNAREALKNPFSVVITHEMAKKYFGDENPMGKILKFENKFDFKITGILQEVPSNSHIKFDFLASFETLQSVLGTDFSSWWWPNTWTYVQLAENSSAAELEKQLVEFTGRHRGENTVTWLTAKLEPIGRIQLHPRAFDNPEPVSDIKFVYTFFAIALLILMIACINFMNLSTAKSVSRGLEVGIRKVVGAKRGQLIKQFLGESVFLSGLAIFFALLLVELFLPRFENLLGKDLQVDFRTNHWFGVGLLGLTLLVGIVSGSYPAMFLSAFKPVPVLKGRLQRGSGKSRLRKMLVVAQFAISIALIISTVVIHNQLKFFRGKDLGFDKEQLVLVALREMQLPGKSHGLLQKIESFKSELRSHSKVMQVSVSSTIPGMGGSFLPFRAEGVAVKPGMAVRTIFVDEAYIETMGINIVAGRNFAKGSAVDAAEGFIINEMAAKEFGWQKPIGKKFEEYIVEGGRTIFEKKGQVLGVVKDFHSMSLHNPIDPVVLCVSPARVGLLLVRIGPDDIAGTLKFVESKWAEMFPQRPFEFQFLDERLDTLYRTEERIGKLITDFSGLAIFIACLGLFGLASFTTEQRTKEVGIRKVLGASVAGVVTLLSKDFVKLVLLANLIAWPVAWFTMNKWLQNFAYRIQIGWWVFAVAGGLALAIALLTVSTQAIRAALANPVESLRYE